MAALNASLPEEMAPATDAFLSITPLLMSHAEYLKAVLESATS